MTLCDTGPIIALLSYNDPNRDRCMQALRTVRSPLITTQACFGEAMHLLRREIGEHGQLLLWNLYRDGTITVMNMDDTAMRRAAELMAVYADLPCDYADATLLALAEETNTDTIFTLNKHCYAYRLTGAKFLTVVP